VWIALCGLRRRQWRCHFKAIFLFFRFRDGKELNGGFSLRDHTQTACIWASKVESREQILVAVARTCCFKHTQQADWLTHTNATTPWCIPIQQRSITTSPHTGCATHTNATTPWCVPIQQRSFTTFPHTGCATHTHTHTPLQACANHSQPNHPPLFLQFCATHTHTHTHTELAVVIHSVHFAP
jgi:hypothetical protein